MQGFLALPPNINNDTPNKLHLLALHRSPSLAGIKERRSAGAKDMFPLAPGAKKTIGPL